MPATSKAKNPRGIELTFTESDHRYVSVIDNKEIDYVSVTSILSRYFPPFDPTGAITERCAKKEGISVEEMKERWAAKGRESCRLGTRMHEVCEDIELGRALRNTAENTVEQKRFDNAIKMAQSFRQRLDIIGVEKLVFDDRLRIAGTIDFLGKSKKTGEYIMIDHKSNEKIEKDNPFNKFCLAPISHLPDNSYTHYALQQSLYAYLLKFGQYIPKDAHIRLFLNHVLPEKAELIELPNYESEIKDIVINYLMQCQ